MFLTDRWNAFKHGISSAAHTVVHAAKRGAGSLFSAVKHAGSATVQVLKRGGQAAYSGVLKPVARAAAPAANYITKEAESFRKSAMDTAYATVDTAVGTHQSIATVAAGAGQLGTCLKSGVGNASEGLGGFLKNSSSWLLVGGGVLLVSLVVLRVA
jgi:hypothetical protein